MKRRDFSLQVALGSVGALGTLLAQPALAQGNPVEGTHYTKLARPAPVAAPAVADTVAPAAAPPAPAPPRLSPLARMAAARSANTQRITSQRI